MSEKPLREIIFHFVGSLATFARLHDVVAGCRRLLLFPYIQMNDVDIAIMDGLSKKYMDWTQVYFKACSVL
jgi:hypothetical protein